MVKCQVCRVTTTGNIPEKEAGEHSNGKMSSVQGGNNWQYTRVGGGEHSNGKMSSVQGGNNWQYTREGGRGAF